MSTASKTTPKKIPTRPLTRIIAAGLALCCSPVLLASCMKAKIPEVDEVQVAPRLERLEAKEEIRSILLDFAMIVDNAYPAALSGLSPKLHSDFRMDVTDFVGGKLHFEGLAGLVQGFGPIMAAAQSNLAPSAIAVEVEGDEATAYFKFINSLVPPPELGLDVDQKVLVLAANTAKFVREGGVWKLKSLEMIHSLAYPGKLGG